VVAGFGPLVERSGGQRPSTVQAGRAAAGAPIPYLEAKPILDRLGASLPADLAARPASELDSAWGDWVSRRNREIRARLERGDEDSIVNLLLFGTTFTRLPRALNDSATIGGPQRAAGIVRGRTADLIAGIAAPGANERLLFARELVERRGIDPTTPAGRERARIYLDDLMARVAGEVAGYARAIESVRSTPGGPEFAVRSSLYRDRGLSSDTSIRPDFAVDQAIDAIRSMGMLDAGSVRRVGVIGPGLDFTDKAEGYDFYPQQTTQPFSVINSLRRLGLAKAADLRLTTFDLSPRVNLHLQSARRRASTGDAYVVVLPRDRGSRWRPGLIAFWRAFGGTIGEETTAAQPPLDGVDVRAVRIRPDVVSSLDVRDVNVVLERLPLADEERFDLIVATNVLVYYDVFEQSLALANIASMLRPGGFLLSNNVLVELPTTPLHAIGHSRTVYSDRPDDSDDIVWYRRQ
jgi:SAM-dependent methyltransferase